MFTKSKPWIPALLLTLLFSHSTLADSYIGLGVSRVDSKASSGGFDTGDANGITVYGGQRFGQMGFEIGYSDVGDIDVPGTSFVITGNIVKIQASFITDPAKEFQVFANLGIAIWDLSSSVGVSDNDTEFAWMVGMNYQFSNQWAFRADYEAYSDLSGLDMNLLTLSINTKF